MSKIPASLAAILVVVLTSACDGNGGGTTIPTTLLATAGPSTSGFGSLGVQPSLVAVSPVAQPFCPDVPPFLGSLNLIVQARGNLPLTLQQVQMTFVDDVGLQAPSVTLPAPVLTRQFGSTLIEARSQRSFPVNFPFGCGTSRTGTLIVVVVTSNDRGQETTAQVRVAVR